MIFLAASAATLPACSWPADRPVEAEVPVLSVVATVPSSGAEGVPTDAVIELGFDAWPESPVPGGVVRMTAGVVDVGVQLEVDLVGRKLRVTPARYGEQPPRLLDPQTGYTVVVAPALRATGGATLAAPFILKFRTGDTPAGRTARPMPRFGEVHAGVIAAACRDCHASPALDLSNEDAAFAALAGQPARVIAGNSAASGLLRKLVGTPDTGGAAHLPLSDAQLALVRDWIDAGAQS